MNNTHHDTTKYERRKLKGLYLKKKHSPGRMTLSSSTAQLTSVPQGKPRLVGRRTCECDLCQRGRRYYRNTKNLPAAEKEWMRGFYDAVLNSECEAHMQEAFADSEPSSVGQTSELLSAGAPARGKSGAANNFS